MVAARRRPRDRSGDAVQPAADGRFGAGRRAGEIARVAKDGAGEGNSTHNPTG